MAEPGSTTRSGCAAGRALEGAANALDRHGELIRKRTECRRHDDAYERQDEPVLRHRLTVRTRHEQLEPNEGHGSVIGRGRPGRDSPFEWPGTGRVVWRRDA
jgi:hypothetical protein